MYRRLAFVVVVVLSALLAGACSVNQGGEITFANPNSPSTTVTPSVPTPDLRTDFQVRPGSVNANFSEGKSFVVGDHWDVTLESWCAAGLVQGVVFIREDGKVMTAGMVSYNCLGKPTFEERRFNGNFFPEHVQFAAGQKLYAVITTAPSISEWYSGQVQVRDGFSRTINVAMK